MATFTKRIGDSSCRSRHPGVVGDEWSEIRKISVDPTNDERILVTGRNLKSPGKEFGVWVVEPRWLPRAAARFREGDVRDRRHERRCRRDRARQPGRLGSVPPRLATRAHRSARPHPGRRHHRQDARRQRERGPDRVRGDRRFALWRRSVCGLRRRAGRRQVADRPTDRDPGRRWLAAGLLRSPAARKGSIGTP